MEEKNIVKKFLDSSYELLSTYEKKGRYYHTLCLNDNSPTVVHKNTNQLTYIVEGTGRVFLDGNEKYIEKGDMILIEAGTTHKFVSVTNKLTLFHIHIPDEGRDGDRYIVEGEDYNRFE